MATAEEALMGGNTPLAQALAAGLGDISYQQTVVFHLYLRLVLPLDGYLFWVRASATVRGGGSQLDVSPLNTAQLNGVMPAGVPPGFSFAVKGSLHIASDSRVEQDAVYGASTVIFSALDEVGNFTDVAPGTTWIGEFEGQKFSIGSRASFYRQANLHHYRATTLNSFMASQLVEDPAQLDANQVIVSNSLPAWLAINSYAPDWPVPMPFPRVPLFPSFLAEPNLTPPYGIVHIDPGGTEGLQMVPWRDNTMGTHQLAKDRVAVTLYGCNNEVASRWLDCLLQYSFDTERFGLMQYTTAVLDDKELQADFFVLSQKKRLIFDVSYNQAAIRSIARQMIEEIRPPTAVTGLVDAPIPV